MKVFLWAKLLPTGLDDKILRNSLIWIDIHCMDRKVQVQNCLCIFWFYSIFMSVFVLVYERGDICKDLKCSQILFQDVIVSQLVQFCHYLWADLRGNQTMFVYIFVCRCMCACVHFFICSFLLCSPVTGPFGVQQTRFQSSSRKRSQHKRARD